MCTDRLYGGFYYWTMRLSLTSIVLLLLLMHVSAEAPAQRVTLKGQTHTLLDALQKINQQTGYHFAWSAQKISSRTKVSAQIVQQPVDAALTLLLKDLPLEYRIDDRLIIIKERPTSITPAGNPPSDIAEEVRGKVIDSLGNALIGASVQVKGSTTTALTDRFGAFTLRNIDDNAVLIISYIGFNSRELPARPSMGDIVLQTSMAVMTEVVVSTGYQQLPRERATGSFATVSNELLNRKPTMDVISRLEGLAGGLVFNRNSVDEAPKLVVRGRSTIYGDDQPLVVVDGFPIEGDLTSINPNDVENISILRDAAAASIWGVRAANGVIVITTRRGAFNQKPTIEFRTQALIGERPDLSYLPYMSSSDFIDLERTWYNAGIYDDYLGRPLGELPVLSEVVQKLMDARQGLITQAQADSYINDLRGVDVRNEYSDAFYRNRVQQQHQFSLRGGSERIRYMFSAGYDKDQSHERGNGMDRITLRADNTYQLMKDLQMHVSLNHAWTGRERNAMGLFGFQGETGQTLGQSQMNTYAFYPYQRLLDAQGNAVTIPRQIPLQYNEQLQQQYNFLDWGYRPADEIHQRNHRIADQHSRLAASLTYNLPLGFSADVRYQFERDVIRDRDHQPIGLYNTRHLINNFSSFDAMSGTYTNNVPIGDILVNNNGRRSSHNFRGQLNYQGDLGMSGNSLSAIVGMEMRDVLFENMRNSFYGYNDRTLQYGDMNKMANYPGFLPGSFMPFSMYGVVDEMAHDWNRFASFYSNASYSIKDRYILSASGRIDKSSLFGANPKDRNVPLWSTGFAWNVNNESFFPQSNTLSELRLRATYGFNGNVSVAQTAFPVAWAGRDYMTQLPTANITTPANPLLQWEKVAQLNLAVDFGLWNNQLSGRFEYFSKRGSDLFGQRMLDPSSGFGTLQANVATMRGSGFDFELNARAGQTVQWNTKFLFSHARDRVVDMASSNYSSAGAGFFRGTQAFMRADREVFPMPGRPVYSIYSYDWAGLDSQGNPQLYDADGQIREYVAVLGSLSATDLIYNGPAQPTFYGGWTHNLNYKGIGITTTLTYKFGHYFRRSSINYFGMASSGMFRSTGHSDYAYRWQQPGDEEITDVPSYPGHTVLAPERDEAYRFSSILVDNASHIRLKDITLSYDLRGDWMQKLRLRTAQLYVYADNIGLLWRANKHGIDPDFVPMGYSNFLPMPRTYTFGLTVGF